MSAVTQQDQEFNLAVLVREHQAGVWRYLRFLGADASEVDDLVQETLLAFLRAKFAYHGKAATASFLRQVARNQLLQRRRKQGREVNTTDMAAAERVWSEVAEDDGLDGYLDALRICTEQLAGRPRQAIQLQYQQGLNRKEVAKAMGMSIDGVKTLLRRTRQKLRECVERKVKPV